MLGVILKEQLNVKQTEERLKATTVKDDVVEEKVVARPPEFAQDVSEARDIIADSLMEIRANGIRYEQKEKSMKIMWRFRSDCIVSDCY